jgi:hypothetical protein
MKIRLDFNIGDKKMARGQREMKMKYKFVFSDRNAETFDQLSIGTY